MTIVEQLMAGVSSAALIAGAVKALFPGLLIPALGKKKEYRVSYSLRLRAANSAYLNKTFTTPTDNKKFTLSVWVKRGKLSGIVSGVVLGNTANTFIAYFDDNNTLNISNNGTTYGSTAVFRDPNAHLHLHIVWDSANATVASRCLVYVNNVSVITTAYSQNTASTFNASGIVGLIGKQGTQSRYLDGLISDVYFVDGQALPPSTFAAADVNGVWSPISPGVLTYGTNGFHLDFADNSGATATTIGKDTSGNGNNWTPNGVSVTSGSTYDSLVDTPTNYGVDTGAGGEVRGNYATFGPLNGTSSYYALSEANLKKTTTSGVSVEEALSTFVIDTADENKFWVELDIVAIGSAGWTLGLSPDNGISRNAGNAVGYGYWYQASNGNKYINNSSSSYGSSHTTNDRIGMAVDCSALTVTFYKQTGGTGIFVSQGAITIASGRYYVGTALYGNPSTVVVNFGQRPWKNANVPAGHKALCSQNLTNQTAILPATFTGNASADGPFIWANGPITAVTINGNVATRGTHFDAVASGIKLRTSSSSYNAAGSNTITAYTAGAPFKYARAQVN
ncbi:MAG: hypothetical protein GC182_03235 [Rhodopseudomonas sp.]|nr:hypothetical protein [Rhodopseudomonas sp.]